MCREERRLFFTNKELAEAFKMFCRVSDRETHDFENMDFSFSRQPDLRVHASYKGQSEKIANFMESEVAAAVLMFCKKHNVPVPKRGRKSMDIEDEQVVMRLSIDRI